MSTMRITALATALAGLFAAPSFSGLVSAPVIPVNRNRCNAAAAKRDKAKRRNVAKHPRSAHKQGGHRWNKVRYHA